MILEPRPGQPMPDGIVVKDAEIGNMADPEWLERGYLLKGELTILQGHGGTNKGTVAAGWAAKVTRGKGEAQTEPQAVLWVTSEDSWDRVIVPRLIAANADLEYAKRISYRRDGHEDSITLPDDVPALMDAVAQLNASLVIIDPILSHLSGKVDSYRDHDVKRALLPLTTLAEVTGCTPLGIHHLGKDTRRGALLSGQASGAFGNTARMVLGIAEHDEDEMLRVLEVMKCNIAGKPRKMLRVELVEVPPLKEPVVRVAEAGTSDKSVDELLGCERPARGQKSADTKKLILRELEAGPQPMDYLKAKAAAETGASGDTTWRAANALKAEGIVDRKKDGFQGSWEWFLLPGQRSASGPANADVETTSVYTTNTDLWKDRKEVPESSVQRSATLVRTEVRDLSPDLSPADDAPGWLERELNDEVVA